MDPHDPPIDLLPAIEHLRQRHAHYTAQAEKCLLAIDVLEGGDVEPAPLIRKANGTAAREAIIALAPGLAATLPVVPKAQRRPMSAKERAGVSKRMKKYWAERRRTERAFR